MEWERRRREADVDAEKSTRRVVDERRDRMVLRQQTREKDYKLKKKSDLDNKSSQDLTRAVKVSHSQLCFIIYLFISRFINFNMIFSLASYIL